MGGSLPADCEGKGIEFSAHLRASLGMKKGIGIGLWRHNRIVGLSMIYYTLRRMEIMSLGDK